MRSADGRYLLAGTPECLARCCNVTGFYRAFPCRPATGCGGGNEGSPIFVPRNFTCAPDGSPPGSRMVIGFDRACWQVDPSVVWRLCPPGSIPETRYCIPDGAMVVAPGAPLTCNTTCDSQDCLDTRPRWITVRPCRRAAWPDGSPLPVVRADGFAGGCVVGRDGAGDCWVADCAAVFQGDLPPGVVVLDGIDFAYPDCCSCQCFGGSPAPLGCDDQYPQQPPLSCCCPPQLNEGARMEYRITRVSEGRAGGYFVRESETWEGAFTVGPDGQTIGSGEYRYRLDYIGPSCPGFPTCPPSGCVEEFTAPDFRVPQCPPPLAVPRPCPGTPGTTWTGSRTCSASYSRQVFTNQNPPQCGQAGLPHRVVAEGRFALTGVDYRECSGGCGTSPLGPLGRTFSAGAGLGIGGLL